MNINGFEKLSLVDYGSNTATTIFTGGCNFRCPFCHNGTLVKDFLELPKYSEEEVFNYLKKRKGLIDGVCVSGGEPTLQKDLLEFLEKVKNLGYLVKLDTNGTHPNVIKKGVEMGVIDYIAMDIKNSVEKYPLTINVIPFDMSNVLESIDFLLSNKTDYEFRTTIIKNYHTADDFYKIGELIKGAKRYYIQKFEDRAECIKSGLEPIEEKMANIFKTIIEPFVNEVYLRGY